MATVRKAHTVWSGDLKSGNGEVTFDSSGIGKYGVTWKARAEESGGLTSPEELIAAAHSACFSMALSNELGKKGHVAQRLETTAEVEFVPGTGITTSKLTVIGKIDGLNAQDFDQFAQDAGKGCPVSQALKGIDINVESQLK